MKGADPFMLNPSTRVKVANAPVRPIFHELTYNPLDGRRKCARCGARDRWQRLVNDPIAGGWRCCTPLPDASVHGDLDHQCSEICVGLGGAA